MITTGWSVSRRPGVGTFHGTDDREDFHPAKGLVETLVHGGHDEMAEDLSGREYNGMNALMLALECEKRGYELPVFCTFDAALSLNYSKKKDGSRQPLLDENGEKLSLVSVQKGERSFPVFITTFTVVDKETKEKIKYEDYKRLSDEEKQRYSVIRR